MSIVRRRKGARRAIGLALVVTCLVLVALAQGALADDALMAQGKQLFEQKCSGCHGLGTGDRPTGPDLAGITQKAEHDWLVRFIREPDKVIESGDPDATALLAKFHLAMPNLGLNSDQVNALIAYLASSSAAPKAETPATKPAGPVGDAARGEALFSGAVAMVNGGAPCLGCHALGGAGLGSAERASFGPDLTAMYGDYGADGVASVLADLSFPSMAPIFAKRPLTAQEQADIGAFLATADADKAHKSISSFVGQVAGGIAGFFVVLVALGWRRLQGVRLPLIEQVRNKGGHKI